MNDPHWAEELARMHCLSALFPDWTGGDPFLLRQLKESIESSLDQSSEAKGSFAAFAEVARQLRESCPGDFLQSYAFLNIDFAGQRWDPLFVRSALIQELKAVAGTAHVFIVVRGLTRALYPEAQRTSPKRRLARDTAASEMTEWIRQWITPATQLHLLFL
jgi:hypothetical protein